MNDGATDLIRFFIDRMVTRSQKASPFSSLPYLTEEAFAEFRHIVQKESPIFVAGEIVLRLNPTWYDTRPAELSDIAVIDDYSTLFTYGGGVMVGKTSESKHMSRTLLSHSLVHLPFNEPWVFDEHHAQRYPVYPMTWEQIESLWKLGAQKGKLLVEGYDRLRKPISQALNLERMPAYFRPDIQIGVPITQEGKEDQTRPWRLDLRSYNRLGLGNFSPTGEANLIGQLRKALVAGI
jgi:hypothetical protein